MPTSPVCLIPSRPLYFYSFSHPPHLPLPLSCSPATILLSVLSRSTGVLRLYEVIHTEKYLYMFTERGGMDLFDFFECYPLTSPETARVIMRGIMAPVSSRSPESLYRVIEVNPNKQTLAHHLVGLVLPLAERVP